MSSVSLKNRGHDLVEKYQAYLESQIEKGNRSLVCKDEKLCKEVEVLLNKGDAQKILNLRGLESLTVMENSLQAFPFKSGHMGLQKLSRAFEVLELAALNLYLYPWRKEYKLVKMFSGMFTHFIKPALTLQQAKELFGLLGYQPSSHNEEEELALGSKVIPADFILRLACAFFTARIECQLLLSILGSVDSSIGQVLHLVKERQKGHSLDVALENTKRKLEVTHAKLTPCIDPELDLYTDENLQIKAQADAVHVTSASSSQPRSYMQSEPTHLTQPPYRETSQSDRLKNEDPSQAEALCVLMPQCHTSSPTNHVSLPQNPGLLESIGEEHMAGDTKSLASEVGGVMCKCIISEELFIYHCEQCNHVHSRRCEHYKKCEVKGHFLSLWSKKDGQQKNTDVPPPVTEAQSKQHKEKVKNSLKNHDCMSTSTSGFFWVCHSCQLIHTHSCITFKTCASQNHNFQPTGILQPPQEVNVPKRHNCLTEKDPVYVICHTCNLSHNYICGQIQNCSEYMHNMHYPVALGDSEIPSLPILYHQCCTANQLPEIACLTCKMFHVSKCPETCQCYSKHKVHLLKPVCVTCFSLDIFTLCIYCCSMYCKTCWFKNPLSCMCGKPFHNSSPV